jgi:hypothetical protein
VKLSPFAGSSSTATLNETELLLSSLVEKLFTLTFSMFTIMFLFFFLPCISVATYASENILFAG